MQNDPISDALSKILNAEKSGKGQVIIKPVSKLLMKILDLLQTNRYVGSYQVIEDSKGRYIVLNLVHAINHIQAIKPRFPVKLEDYEKYEKRFLPANDFGIIIVSTNQGLMTHVEAKQKRLGGKLIAYCY
ncbi:MAG: 30S ribosomal protein S8 [Candidatus Woesearchaeota archaeon]